MFAIAVYRAVVAFIDGTRRALGAIAAASWKLLSAPVWLVSERQYVEGSALLLLSAVALWAGAVELIEMATGGPRSPRRATVALCAAVLFVVLAAASRR